MEQYESVATTRSLSIPTPCQKSMTCLLNWREDVHETWPCARVSANSTWWGFKTAHNYQHPQGQYNRLPFGIHSAPAVFQRTMEGILRDIPHVSVYIDDILVTGRTGDEHLDWVLTNEGLHLKREREVCIHASQDWLSWPHYDNTSELYTHVFTINNQFPT